MKTIHRRREKKEEEVRGGKSKNKEGRGRTKKREEKQGRKKGRARNRKDEISRKGRKS